MATIVSVHSFRGGTRKSNTTANVAATLTLSGRRVGVIDADIQSPGIHVLFGVAGADVQASLNDFLFGEREIGEIAIDVTDGATAARMADEVRAREARLQAEVRELRIEIDDARQSTKVAEITSTEYFKDLRSRAAGCAGGSETRVEAAVAELVDDREGHVWRVLYLVAQTAATAHDLPAFYRAKSRAPPEGHSAPMDDRSCSATGTAPAIGLLRASAAAPGGLSQGTSSERLMLQPVSARIVCAKRTSRD